MTTGAHFHIDQATNPVVTGATDTARVDLRLAPIALVGDAAGNSSPAWTITAWPPGSARAALAGATSFTPTAYTPDVPGTYRVEYNVGDGIGANHTEFIFAVTADASGIIYDDGIREPAFGERLGNDNSSGNDRGWAQAFEAGMSAQVPVIGTHATLLNRRIAKHRAIYLAGFYAARDGGEGLFRWDGSSTATHIDGMVVQPGFGTGGAMTTGRWVRQFAGHEVHGHWFGMKPGDTAFNNSAPFAAAMAFAQAKYRIGLDGVRYHFWDTFVPATQAQFDISAAVIHTSNQHIIGIRGKTVFEAGTPGLNGDPTNPAQIPSVPSTLTAVLRSHLYTLGQRVYSNGHSYICTVTSGTTTANPADAPSGVFSGTHADGTVNWRFDDLPYRGGAPFILGDQCKDTTIEGIIFDGLAPWVDNNIYPAPPGSPTYLLTNGANAPLMYAYPNYDQVTYAYGWDVHHKGLWNGGKIGGVAFGTGLDRNHLIDCQIINFRGELLYGDGLDTANPHTTLTLTRVWFREGPVGLSSSVGMVLDDCRFTHLHQALDTARGLSDFTIRNTLTEDCAIGFGGEQGLQSQDKPGITNFHHNTFRNVYGAALFWNTSFAASAVFAAMRAFFFTYNKAFDCGWGGGAAFTVSPATDTFPKQGCRGVDFSHNEVHVGAMVASTRSGGATGTVAGGFAVNGRHEELEFSHNRTIYDDEAINTGHTIDKALFWQVTAGSNRCRVHDNYFTSQNGITLTSSTADQYMGAWWNNENFCAANTVSWTGNVISGQVIAAAGVIFPKFPVWTIIGGTVNTVITSGALTHPERWADGQIIRLRHSNDTFPVLIPESSATHQLLAPRLMRGNNFLELTLRRSTKSHSTDTPIWIEVSYLDITTGQEPDADVAAPPFRLVNSEAPQIQMWGVHTIHLTPSVGTDFNNVVQAPDESVIQVYFNANTRFRHNTGAGAVKLLLLGGADFLPTSDGETAFFVDPDAGIAVEIPGRRIVGGVVTGFVPDNRTLTGTTPITVAGDHTAHDLSVNRAIGLDATAAITTSGVITGGSLISDTTVEADTDVIATRIVSSTGLIDNTGTVGLSLNTSNLNWGSAASPATKGIRGQDAISGNVNGGGCYVEGGVPVGTGVTGGAWLGFTDVVSHAKRMVEAFAAATSRRWVSLCKIGQAVSADVPDGDGLIFIAHAATNPTLSPSNGITLWSDNTGKGTRTGSVGTALQTVGYVTKQKGSDQSVTSSTTLTDESDLQFAIGANEKWMCEWRFHTTCSTVGRVKVAVVTPSGTLDVLGIGIATGGGAGTGDTFSNNTQSSATGIAVTSITLTDGIVDVTASIANGATPGTVKLQFAQVSSDGTATVIKALATLRAHQVAT